MCLPAFTYKHILACMQLHTCIHIYLQKRAFTCIFIIYMGAWVQVRVWRHRVLLFAWFTHMTSTTWQVDTCLDESDAAFLGGIANFFWEYPDQSTPVLPQTGPYHTTVQRQKMTPPPVSSYEVDWGWSQAYWPPHHVGRVPNPLVDFEPPMNRWFGRLGSRGHRFGACSCMRQWVRFQLSASSEVRHPPWTVYLKLADAAIVLSTFSENNAWTARHFCLYMVHDHDMYMYICMIDHTRARPYIHHWPTLINQSR